MAERKVLVSEKQKRPTAPLTPDTETAWRWIGWFGLVLAVVGLWDFALAWYPTRFGSAEWEFGTITSSYSGLPLPTMGLAAMLGSGLARGVRWQVVTLAVGLIALGAMLLLGYVVFLTTVPVALGAVEGVVALGIKKAIAKTTMLALVFPGGYLGAGVLILRHLRRQAQQTV